MAAAVVHKEEEIVIRLNDPASVLDRPISLLPTLSKVFERVIFNQLYLYLDHNNLLSEEQYGFRANHSAELAAIKLADYIVQEIDRKLNLSTYILIFQKHSIH